ncbi:unnamed protein product [Onchocerca flexuosa]|uniref:Clathrin_bdg domain-containing protein n=1 Tax=Onchocerca flexuosa TaxID=387005 RepID=A0A183H581_9BILA|nr:unnamed protein product [Onchocerca flexuosa]
MSVKKFNIYRASTSTLPEQSQVVCGSISEVESKPSAMMPPFSISTDIVGEVDLSSLSPAERNQIISVMKAAESEESNIIPPASSFISVLPPITQVDDEFHDNLARLSPFEKHQILAVMKAAQEEHFEATHAVLSHPLSQRTSGAYDEGNEWRESKNSGYTNDTCAKNAEKNILEIEKIEILTSFMESSATSSVDVTLPQLNSDYTRIEDSNCDPSVTNVNMISSVVIGTDIQEAGSPSAPGSSDYGSTDFDYTYGDDRRFIFDGVTQMEDSSKENQDADSGVGTFDWSDQGHYEWTERKPRMWTTVFSEEEEKSDIDMQKHGKSAEDYIKAVDSHHQIVALTDDSENTIKESSVITEKNLCKADTAHDSDEQCFIKTDSSSKKTVETAAQHEILKTAHIMRTPPAITVTDHGDGIRIAVDDDSDAETSPSSDEDDYPDQVIEVPSAPSKSYDEVEKEQEQQEAFGKAVLQQIQAFGEAANDEFDVQWVHDNLIKNEVISNIFAHDESTTPAVAYDTILLSVETEHADKTPNLNTINSERKNPFLNTGNNDSTLKIVEENENSLESEDLDYTAAASYYNSQSFLTHRPGSVYTIPEDKEQDDGQVSTDSKFYAKEMVRRVRAESSILKAACKSSLLSDATTALNIVSTLNSAQKDRDVTITVYSSDYYSQLQKRQNEALKQTLFHGAETDTRTPAVETNVDSFEASFQLKHITTSSSTVVQKEPAFSLSSSGVSSCNSAMLFDVSSHRMALGGFSGIKNGWIDEVEISTNSAANKNDSGTDALKMSAGITRHLKIETSPNSVCNIPSFHKKLGQSFNSPSKAKSALLSETLGSGLDSNVTAISPRFENDPIATRSPTFDLYI